MVSFYIYLPINVCILTKLLKVSIMERLFSLRVTSVQEIVSKFPHLHYSPHHLCSENQGRLTDVDATSLSHLRQSTSSQRCSSAGPGLYSRRNCYVYNFRVFIENDIIACANRQDNEQYVCVYSNSRNDVPRVAQRYGTIAAHTRRRASVLVVCVVFCVHMHSFAGLIRRTPPPTFSDTAITDRHSDTTIFQLRAHWVRISWSIGSEKSFGHVPPVGVEPSTSCMQGEHLIH